MNKEIPKIQEIGNTLLHVDDFEAKKTDAKVPPPNPV